ncbi:hypothetical protein SAMN06269117_11916 [Balnearium lithotrophicum]|uniref:Bacterial CdiA-CT RNAse A domain-containing protein n=1 Tax=Balnearium lithotrophicum TaxID=223788 RepID=A0A521DBB3_9BACT|nr:RNase A-like domain-containing protein [Balnearium lithotrophicum]SMO68928.1 hypothetical protein SAMN06269117_11916 [Balnearium lithotrophicum]
MKRILTLIISILLLIFPVTLYSCFSGGEKVKRETLTELNYRGLKFYETVGGHTIRRHVGKNYKWLVERLESEPRLRSASSFYDLRTAEEVVRRAISENRNRIKEWLLNSRAPNKLVLIYRGEKPIGIKVVRGRGYYTERVCKSARIVLKKDKRFGFIVLTAYPT